MATPNALTYDAQGRLAADLPCVSCGHNLRGLLPTAVCTECAEPIKWSFQGSHLFANDPVWVNRLRGGVASLVLTLPFLWHPVAWLAFAYGLWRLSTPEPLQRGARELVLQAWLRVALIGAATLGMGYTVWEAWDPNLSLEVSLRYGLPIKWVWFALGVGWAGLMLAVAALVRPLAKRSASSRLRKLCTRGLYASGLAVMLLVGGGVGNATLTQLAVLDALSFFGAGMLIFATVVFGVMLLVAWRILDQAEVQARRSRLEIRAWQGPPPGSRWLAQRRASVPAESADTARDGA